MVMTFTTLGKCLQAVLLKAENRARRRAELILPISHATRLNEFSVQRH